MHFWAKVIPINFQLEVYLPFKEKDVSIFSCSIDITVTSEMTYRLFTRIKQPIYFSVAYT